MTRTFGDVLKTKIRNGQMCLGGWVSLNDTVTMRLMGRVGFDWLLIDMEHSPITIESLEHMLFMLEGSETVPIVRVPDGQATHIKQALDVGAGGIMVPLLQSADEVQAVVQASRYPPVGRRGYGPRAASDFYRNLDDYSANANERIMVIVQIECREAVENLDSIVHVDGLDAVFIGPSDLAKSLGIAPADREKKLFPVIDEIIQKAQAADIPVGIDTWSEEIARWSGKGIQFCTVAVDWILMEEAAEQALATCRNMLKKNTCNCGDR